MQDPNIAFTIVKTFWLFYSVGVTLIRDRFGIVGDGCGNDDMELEEKVAAYRSVAGSLQF